MERDGFGEMTAAEAAEKMMDLYGDRLFRLCFLYLGNLHDAQDAVQEVILKVYRHWHAFRHESSEMTWLTRIAIRTCRDMRRSAWFRHVDRMKNAGDDAGAHAAQDPFPGEVTQAVFTLPEKYRLPILLHYYQGLVVKDVASILNIPLNTALTRLKRGRDILRGKLTEGGELR